MTRLALAAALLFAFLLPASARGDEIPAALKAELLALYDKYNAAAKKGDFKTALPLRTAKRRADIEKALKDPKEKEFANAFLRMAPESYTVEHAELAPDGNSAEIETIATVVAPPHVRAKDGIPADGRVQQEITLAFAKEKAGWRYDQPTWGARVGSIKACDESKPAVEADFDDSKESNIGGMIRRVVFADGYTVFVARIVDEENCLYLPDKAALQKAGLNTDLLAPRAMFEAEVIKHRTDDQRVWVQGLTVRK